MSSSRIISMVFAISLVFCSCSSQNKSEADASSATKQSTEQPSGVTFDFSGTPVTVAGITFTPAIEWDDQGAATMRVATYTYGPLESDEQPAELAVYYFGPNQGGGVEANIQRWIGQMDLSSGDPASAASIDTILVNEKSAYVLNISGTYNEPVGGMMTGKSTPRENYRMVGVIVEAPEGSVFFKLTGPDHTAKVMSEGLMAMVGEISSASHL